MEGLKLGMREQQYYAELFQSCDIEGNGKVTGLKASELFLASGLNPDVLKQITELCGAKRLGHFGRSQFYVALKLVALAQAGLPVRLDALNSGKDFPLPKFSSKGNEQVFALGDRKKSCGEPDSIGTEGKSNAQLSGQLPPPPVIKKSHSRSLSGQYRGVVPDVPVIASSQSSQFSSSQGSVKDDSPHNSKSPPFSPTESPPISPANQKPLLKQNTAPSMVFASSLTNLSSGAVSSQGHIVMTSSVDSADFTSQLINPGSLVSDSGHVNPVALSDASGVTGDQVVYNSLGSIQTNHGQIQHANPQPQQHHLQSQENGFWTMFEDDENHMLIGSGVKQYSTLEPPSFDSSSISSEAESVDDIWTISDEQREYYINQFKTMEPDLSAVIIGPVAKHFFEKSKLPVVELSKIWQLSDFNCDGALSLEEFCIAMHLVVLRRNDIELPDHLPISLMPYSTLANDEPFAADLPPGSTLKRATPPSPEQNIAQWTAFVSESPDSGDVHSPAHLANFEFAKPLVDPDLKIVQPVPLHMLSDGRPVHNDACDHGRVFSVTDEPIHSEGDRILATNLPAIIRGQIQVPPGSSLEGSGAVERPNDFVAGQGQIHCPPTPPPRPPHGRSMSVDVKSSSQLIAPAIPPRVSPKEVQSALKFGEPGTVPILEHKSVPKSFIKSTNQTHRRSASLGIVMLTGVTVPHSELLSETSQTVATFIDKERTEEDDVSESAAKDRLQPKPAVVIRQNSRDSRDIHMALRTHKERNTMLTRLNSELNQELQEVMEQRIALEIQLEHLRPFSS